MSAIALIRPSSSVRSKIINELQRSTIDLTHLVDLGRRHPDMLRRSSAHESVAGSRRLSVSPSASLSPPSFSWGCSLAAAAFGSVESPGLFRAVKSRLNRDEDEVRRPWAEIHVLT
jgi:hypothetical protein